MSSQNPESLMCMERKTACPSLFFSVHPYSLFLFVLIPRKFSESSAHVHGSLYDHTHTQLHTNSHADWWLNLNWAEGVVFEDRVCVDLQRGCYVTCCSVWGQVMSVYKIFMTVLSALRILMGDAGEGWKWRGGVKTRLEIFLTLSLLYVPLLHPFLLPPSTCSSNLVFLPWWMSPIPFHLSL